MEDVTHHIFQRLSPKLAIDGMTAVDGPALAALAQGYVEVINTSGALSDLEQGWQAIIKLRLKELTEKLVKEYSAEMEESLSGHFHMEEENLMRIHVKHTKGR